MVHLVLKVFLLAESFRLHLFRGQLRHRKLIGMGFEYLLIFLYGYFLYFLIQILNHFIPVDSSQINTRLFRRCWKLPLVSLYVVHKPKARSFCGDYGKQIALRNHSFKFIEFKSLSIRRIDGFSIFGCLSSHIRRACRGIVYCRLRPFHYSLRLSFFHFPVSSILILDFLVWINSEEIVNF